MHSDAGLERCRFPSSTAGTYRRDVTAPCRELFETLSARELQILRLLATGATNAEMAHTLNLSEGTIRNAIARMTRKLGVADRTQAALLASRAGLDA